VTVYRSKPSEIEAIQWTGDNYLDVVAFGGSYSTRHGVALHLLAGKDGAQEYVPVPVGHWIVRSVDDWTDHWPVDPDYFANKYEPVDP
jgi:hypothetical protein